MTFDRAVEILLGHEGEFSDHPADPGGATRWGVTERVARANGYTGPMRQYPIEHARLVYRKLYWATTRCDELPSPLRYPVFDAAVNSGVRQSILWLQRAVGASPDGVIGPKTIAAAWAAPAEALARRMISDRLRFMTDRKTWPVFGRGWARRIADILRAEA
jgi:lysozyme family protein